MRAEYAVSEFGRAVGLESLTLQPTGQVRLGLPSGEWLSLEEHGDDLLVNLVAPSPFVPPKALLHALQACEARRSGAGPAFQVGLMGEGSDAQLVLVTRMPAAFAGADDIRAAVDASIDWLARWRSQSGETGSGGR